MKASNTYSGLFKKMQKWLLSIFNLLLYLIIAQYYLNLLGLYMATFSLFKVQIKSLPARSY